MDRLFWPVELNNWFDDWIPGEIKFLISKYFFLLICNGFFSILIECATDRKKIAFKAKTQLAKQKNLFNWIYFHNLLKETEFQFDFINIIKQLPGWNSSSTNLMAVVFGFRKIFASNPYPYPYPFAFLPPPRFSFYPFSF